MQVRNIDLSLQTIATDNVTILDAVEIGEFRGNPTLANPTEAFDKIKSNCQRNGRESNGVDKLYITGRNAGFAYLAATVGFAPTSIIYTGTGIGDLGIKICNILTSTNEEDVQVIDISAPMTQGVVTEGLFENVTMDMSSGRANICSTPDSTMTEVLLNLKITGKSVVITGAAPIWLTMSICYSLVSSGITVVYKDVSNSFELN
jgi:hypothetical protein